MSVISKEKWDMKRCNTCGNTKDYSEFGKKKYKSGNYGLTHECKQCKSIKASKKYSSESKEDRERRVSLRKKWLENNRDIVNGLKSKYRLQKKVLKLSSIPHDQHVKAYIKHKEKLIKQSLLKHDQHVKEWKSDDARMYKWSYKHNINTMLYSKLKRGVYRCMGSKASYSNWSDYLGYTIDELRVHIEKQFTYGMSWDNRHEWHIDHIVPICAFVIESVDSEEFKVCFGLRNLRPIWPDDNREKYWSVDRIFNKKNKIKDNVINQ